MQRFRFVVEPSYSAPTIDLQSDDIYALCKQALRRTGPADRTRRTAVPALLLTLSLPLHQEDCLPKTFNCSLGRGTSAYVQKRDTCYACAGWRACYCARDGRDGNGTCVARFLLAIAVPLSPTLLWAIREVRRQAEAAAGVDRLKDFVEDVWRDLNRNALTEAAALCRSRQLQDAIMVHRRTSPLVPDFFYRYRRAEDEEQMEVSAARMVAEITGRPDTL